jgi:hydrogenase maturation protease
MGDEGVGVRAAQLLAGAPLGEDVAVLDGGTGGFHLLPHFDAVERLILIDAALDGLAAGTVRVIRPRFLRDFPRALSAHEIGLRDLIETATLLGAMPPTELVTISVQPPLALGLELSPAVEAAVPEVIDRVLDLLAQDAPAPAREPSAV